MTIDELTYRTHISSNGIEYTISPIYDCYPNVNGLYCEIYNTNLDDVIDNIVIHDGENADEVVTNFMNKWYK